MTAQTRSLQQALEEKDVEKDILAPDSRLICSCFEFSLGEMRGMLAKNANMGFDTLLAESKAGSRCTACLLDLEYYFVHLPRIGKPVASDTQRVANRVREPLRRQIYRWIDAIAPRWPIALKDHVPIIAAPGIQQWVWLANYEFLYERNRNLPEFDVNLRLRDAAGQQVHQQNVWLGRGKEWRGEMSQFLPPPGRGTAGGEHADMSIGWLEITRTARSDGVRGTTRPQIEIVTSKSACAVHGQAAGFTSGNEIEMVCNPDDDRVFVSVINPSRRAVSLTMAYPIDPLEEIKAPCRSIPVTVPPNGARLHEVVLRPDERRNFAGRLFKFRWRGTGVYKAHVIIATPQLDRFSIDHA